MLLGFAAGWAALVLLSLFPPRRPGTLGFLAFFPAWLIGELPYHFAVFLAAGTVLFTLTGGPSLAGLGLAALALLGLARHAQLGARARAAVDAALGGAGAGRPRRRARLATLFPFAPPDLVRVRDVPYGLGGKRRRLDVWRAAGLPPGARRPALLFIHGGGWVIGDKELQGLCTVHEMAAAGWVCFSMNYRLSPRAVWPDHLDDVKLAIAWIRRHAAEYGADPDTLVLAGASAGAHLASLAALTGDTPELRVQGCIAFYGLYDLQPPYFSRAFQRLLLERLVFQRKQSEHPADFTAASPIAQVHPGAPPFLIFHGTFDNLVPVAGARRFAEALRAVSRAPVIYAELPGGQHAFEIFHCARGAAAIDGARRFCQSLEARKWDETSHNRPAAAD